MTVHWPTTRRLLRWFWWEWVWPLEPSSQLASWRWILPPISLGRSYGLQASSTSDYLHRLPYAPHLVKDAFSILRRHHMPVGKREHLNERQTFVRLWVVRDKNVWMSTRNCRHQHERACGGLTLLLASTWQRLNTRFVALKKPTHNSPNSWPINQTARTDNRKWRFHGLILGCFFGWLIVLNLLRTVHRRDL